MAIDPIVIAKTVEEARKTLKVIVEKYYKTKRTITKEEESTKRKNISAKKENREVEIRATENMVNQNTKSMKDVAMDTASRLQKTTNDVMEKIAEIGNKNIEKLIDIQDRHQSKLEERDKMHKAEIEEAQREAREYQGMLQQASVEITKYRTKHEIINQFAQNILSFAEAEAMHKQKLFDTKNAINRIKISLQPLQDNLQNLKTKIAVLESHYEKLHQDFDKQIYLLESLEHEYKDNMEESKYYEAYKREMRELKHLQDEIEHKELELLNRELDRLNKIEEIEPILQELERVEIALEYLESEHERLISIGTHRLSDLQIENQNSNETSDIIDISTYDTSKTNNLLTQ